MPAAISAPTPISALVHSSTLVTAGILLIFKIYGSINFGYILVFIRFLIITGATSGGLIAILEKDIKKIVAYSTISQISVILFMGILGFLRVALIHMIFHATFKSYLFVSCGLIFMTQMGLQNFNITNPNSRSTLNSIILTFSVYIMTGIIFSSSFFSKDLFLENIFSNISNY